METLSAIAKRTSVRKFSQQRLANSAFTLLELMIVVIIIGILASLAIPMFQGAVIKAKMAELYPTVSAIEKAEEIYFYEYGEYPAQDDGVPGGDLDYSNTQARIDKFRNILGLEIPGMNSVFVYGVYSDPAVIYVRVRAHYDDWGIFCNKVIEGVNKGTWGVTPTHPWAKYINVP